MTKRPSYVCATCGQDFTRRYNAIPHNQNIHLGKAEIVRFLEYMVGRISNKYLPSDPLLYRHRNRNKKDNSFVHESENHLHNGFSNSSTVNKAYKKEYQNRIEERNNDHINSLDNNGTSVHGRNDMLDLIKLFQEYNKKVDESLQKQKIKEKIEDIERMLYDFYKPDFVRILITYLYNKYNATTDYRGFKMELENYRNTLVNRY